MSQNLNSAVAVIGIDIGKNSFHIVGLDSRGAIVLRQKWSRGQVGARFTNMPPCLIGMEACVGAHHLSRKLKALGHDARLMPAKYVRPYSKGNDGVTNDLLTAGGALGLQSATAAGIVDPLHPTKEELRRLAIYNNYRALVDISTRGCFTVLYGPNVKPDGTAQDPSTHKRLIAGDEYIAFEKGDDGRPHVTMMVQIPDGFDPSNSCIITAPSSGSRGVYGAIATAGEWGLKHGCAVAYTDKGTGNGAHDLQNNTVNLIQGERADAALAGDDSNFTAELSDSQRAAFNAATPNRFAFKHAHSQLIRKRTGARLYSDCPRNASKPRACYPYSAVAIN